MCTVVIGKVPGNWISQKKAQAFILHSLFSKSKAPDRPKHLMYILDGIQFKLVQCCVVAP